MNIISKKTQTVFTANPVYHYIAAFVIGLIAGFNIIPSSLFALISVVAGLMCIKYAFENNLYGVFTVLPYLVYNEIYARRYITVLPYLYVQYILIIVFVVLLITQKRSIGRHSGIFILMVIYSLLEILDSSRTNDPTYAKMLITNTVCITAIIGWGSFNYLPSKLINHLFNHIKIAGIYLTAIVFVAHLRGNINYGLTSNFGSSNGLAPVQLSAYLGFVCILFFWEIMNYAKGFKLVLNLGLFAFSAIIMVLTFSRGGLYFVGISIVLYLLFNRSKARSYYLLFLLIPVAIFVADYVISVTGGMIEQRYREEGSSGRDRLIESGLTLFLNSLVTGVGTANFNTAIIENELYEVQSGAHNEFIRAAAEHGLLGICTFIAFFGFLFLQILQRRSIEREYAIYFFIFFCLVTIHNGLKISLQPLVMMLVVATPSVVKIKRATHVQVA
ncbi:MAG: O-antigen ligase family protein [Ilyomonas sp.]